MIARILEVWTSGELLAAHTVLNRKRGSLFRQVVGSQKDIVRCL